MSFHKEHQPIIMTNYLKKPSFRPYHGQVLNISLSDNARVETSHHIKCLYSLTYYTYYYYSLILLTGHCKAFF